MDELHCMFTTLMKYCFNSNNVLARVVCSTTSSCTILHVHIYYTCIATPQSYAGKHHNFLCLYCYESAAQVTINAVGKNQVIFSWYSLIHVP